jgi:hypothetical protein
LSWPSSENHLTWKKNCDWLTELLPQTTEMSLDQAVYWVVENLVWKVRLLRKHKERDKKYERLCQEWKIPSQTQKGPSQSSCALTLSPRADTSNSDSLRLDDLIQLNAKYTSC